MKRLSIIGAGNMGSAIASLFLLHGWQARLIDPSEQARLSSRRKVLGAQAGGSEDDSRISWHASLAAAHDAELVIEAAPENLELKTEIFRQLEDICSPQTILASNTSGIPINMLAQALSRPERFIGAHFFTPADIIPLVEIVPSLRTAPETGEYMLAVLRGTGKLPVLLKQDIPGFIANRLQHALAREAMSLLEKGVASARDIDTVAKWSLGVRLALTGPLEQRDINGLDIHHAIAGYLYENLESSRQPLRILAEKVEQGRLGVKSGHGFYDWDQPEQRRSLRRKDAALRRLVSLLRESETEGHAEQ